MMKFQLKVWRTVICAAAAVMFGIGFCGSAIGQLNITGNLITVEAPFNFSSASNDTDMLLLEEAKDVVLQTPLSVDAVNTGFFDAEADLVAGTISEGAILNSYFFHSAYDGSSGAQRLDTLATITFGEGEQILGLIYESQPLVAAEQVFGLADVIYVANGGIDFPTPGGDDTVDISADRTTLTLDFRDIGLNDTFRIITAIPEPSAAAVLAIGVFGFTRRRSGE